MRLADDLFVAENVFMGLALLSNEIQNVPNFEIKWQINRIKYFDYACNPILSRWQSRPSAPAHSQMAIFLQERVACAANVTSLQMDKVSYRCVMCISLWYYRRNRIPSDRTLMTLIDTAGEYLWPRVWLEYTIPVRYTFCRRVIRYSNAGQSAK